MAWIGQLEGLPERPTENVPVLLEIIKKLHLILSSLRAAKVQTLCDVVIQRAKSSSKVALGVDDDPTGVDKENAITMCAQVLQEL
eukprot:2026886-Amphidinium_carterae.1